MMTFQDLRKLIASERTNSLRFQECHNALNEEAYEELGPGALTAEEAAQIFRLRRETARRSRKDVVGLDETIDVLERLPRDDRILLFHLSCREQVFSIFVSDRSGGLLGCVRVRRDVPG